MSENYNNLEDYEDEFDEKENKFNIVIGILAIIIVIIFCSILFLAHNKNNKPPKFESAKEHSHIYSEEKIVDKEPTCTDKGEKSRHCTFENCVDKIDLEYIEPLGHEWNEKGSVSKPASCNEKGVIIFDCIRCDATNEEELFPTDHVYRIYENSKTVTCQENGIIKYQCTKCNSIKEEVIKTNGHVLNVAVFTDNTDINNIKYYKTCKLCGNKIFTDVNGNVFPDQGLIGLELPKYENCEENCSNGIHMWNFEPTITDSTCTTTGYKVYTCLYCNNTKTEEISIKEHNIVEQTKESTCKEEGYVAQICSLCGFINSKIYKDKLEHEWDEDIIQESICGEEGRIKYTCEICGEIEYDTYVEKGSHEYVTEHFVENGKEYDKTYCKKCGTTSGIVYY